MARPALGGGTPRTVYVALPTNGASRTSTTLGSLDTPWTSTIIVPSGQSVQYNVNLSLQFGGDDYITVALACDSTIVDRTNCRISGNTDIELRSVLNGVHSPAAGSRVYEVYIGQKANLQVFVSSVVNTSTGTGATLDAVSSMILELVVLG